MHRLLILFFLLLVLPGLAGASQWYGDDTVIITQTNDRDVLALLPYLYDRVILKMPIIELPEGTRYDDVNTAMGVLGRAYPELSILDNQWSVNYYRNEPDIAISVEPGYLDHDSMARLTAMAQSIVGEAVGDQAARAELLHDWLCDRVAYDKSGGHTASAYGAVVNGWAQCEGYAKALVLLYRMAGIPSGVVTGYFHTDDESGGPHAWVVARIGGVNTLIDPTANDSIDHCVTHWYYGLTDDQMAADHDVDEGSVVPVCSSQAMNWHARRGLMLCSMSDMNAVLQQFVTSRQPMEIRFANASLYRDFSTQLDAVIDAYNAVAPGEMRFYGSYRVWTSPEQNGAMLEWR